MTAAARRPLLMVIEPEPDWGPELMRQFPAEEICCVPSLPADGAMPDLAGAACPWLLLAGPRAIEQFLALRRTLSTTADVPAVVVVLNRADLDLEFELRQLGVTSVFSAEDQRESVVAACRRWLRSAESIRSP